jgi:hypothetical protein
VTDPGFTVNNKRGRARQNSGLVLGQSVQDAKDFVSHNSGRLPRDGVSMALERAGSHSAGYRSGDSDDVVSEMRLNRRVAMRKQGYGGNGIPGNGGSGANMAFATGRPRDPMFYWRQNNIPWDVTKDDELKKIRAFCRVLYLTHPVVAACTDIFTKFPIQGMHFECKDSKLEDFYSALFFDQLDYKNFFVDIGRERWTVGEAWPLGSFNEELGVWEDDELLNPDDVEVEKSPFLKDPRYLIRLPETLRRVLQDRSPHWEYKALMRNYPELSHYASDDSLMPVSNVLLQQVKFKADTFHKRGLPILMRGFRAIVQEEMLNAAMDAIADRLYTPLILAKLGATASDLGTEVPWIPTETDLGNFNEAVDVALAADFRMITHHFAVDMVPVFGRENMPDLSADFDRILDRILMVWGISRTMLQGAEQGETYAADALNRDIITQLLSDHQQHLIGFYESRARIVAEASEHWDYDVRGGQRYVKMEEIFVEDPDNPGEGKIIEQPKLLIPELRFDTINLADETQERQFVESLAASGVPVPYKQRLRGTGMDFDEIIEERKTEQVSLAIAEQETRQQTFKALRDAGLPIPEDLITDFQPKARVPNQPAMTGAGDAAIPSLGDQPTDLPALAPSPEDLAQNEDEDEQGQGPATEDSGMGQVIVMPTTPQPGDQRPPESDEQRATMPKASSRRASLRNRQQLSRTAVHYADDHREAHYELGQISAATADFYQPPDNSEETNTQHYQPTGKFGAPRHVGMRRYVDVPSDLRWNEDWNTEVG